MVAEAGGEPAMGGIVPDDPAALEPALSAALTASDLIVISAGSSVGARDETARVVGRLGEPGIWCHGLAIKPGKPTLLADCDGVPVIGLPALLSVLTAADGYVIVPEEATGLDAGTEVEVTLYR